MRLTRICSIGAFTALVIAITGYGSAYAAGSSARTAKPAAAATKVLFYAGVENAEEVIPQLAVDEHLFPKSVKVTLKYGIQSLVLPLLASDKAQFLLNPSPSVEVVPSTEPIKWAAAYEHTADTVFITRPSITSCSQMQGQQVGIIVPGSVLALQSQIALSSCGLTASDYQIEPLGSMGSVLAAFVAGTVDGVAVDPVTALAAEAKLPGTHVIYNLWSNGVPWNNMGVATNSDWAASHPKAEEAVLEGLNEALQVFHSKPAEAKRALAQVTGLGADAVDAAYKILNQRFQATLTPVSIKAEKNVIAVLKASGAQISDTPQTYMLNPKYLDAALSDK